MDALRRLVEELEQDRSLDEPGRLCQRVEALDYLEVYLLDGTRGDGIHQRAQAVSARLEAVNLELYRSIRREIQQGAGPNVLLPWVDKSRLVEGEGYDYLDELILGVLQPEDFDVEPTPLAQEMVRYQPTPARHIFDLIRRTAFTGRDVLVDLGSGMGHVPLLVSICTDARSVGIELEPAYIACARQSAQRLNLNNATFLEQDARSADLSAGTVFYLYTPFTGTILRAVLDSLRREASRRQIRVGTFGPCTPVVGEERWLEAKGPLYTDRIAVFRSRVVK